MRILDILNHRLRSLFSRTGVEQELDEELRYHLEREIEEHTAAGMSRADAYRAARRSLAGLAQAQDREVQGDGEGGSARPPPWHREDRR